MAYPNYQIPTKLTFFPSYLQYAYATGQIYDVYAQYRNENNDIVTTQAINENAEGTQIIKKEDVYGLANLDPSKTLHFNNDQNMTISFKTNSKWNFDFGMFLGHNFNGEAKYHPVWYNALNGGRDFIPSTQIVNYNPENQQETGSYNGWSAFNMIDVPDNREWIGIDNVSNSTSYQKIELGSISFGKKWEAPHNIDLTGSINYGYGNKQKKTISGKTISSMKYYKPQNWAAGLNAWELSEPNTYPNPRAGRNGLRRWEVKWSMLAENKVLPQNAMQNSLGWSLDENSEYSTGASGDSLYDSENGIDFVTSVLKLTMGSHLPVVIRISESNNPDQWAIVRITKHKISQRNPKLIDVQLTLEEQV